MSRPSRIAYCRAGTAGIVALLAFAGCAKRQGTMGRPPQVNPPPAVKESLAARSGELAESSRRLEELAQTLPGRTDTEHRQRMQEVFAELARILPNLYGPNPPGTFRQQLRVVENARTELASSSGHLAIEPTVDTALRAGRDALESISARAMFDQAKMAPLMDRLNAALDRLDAARGGSHPLATAEAVEAMAGMIRQMSDAMIGQLGNDDGSGETKPGAPPTQPAATQPAASH